VAVAVGEVGSEDFPVLGGPESGYEGGLGPQLGVKVEGVLRAGLDEVVDGAGDFALEPEELPEELRGEGDLALGWRAYVVAPQHLRGFLVVKG